MTRTTRCVLTLPPDEQVRLVVPGHETPIMLSVSRRHGHNRIVIVADERVRIDRERVDAS